MSFSERLRRRELLLGTMVTLPSPEVAEMISKCGVDWLFLDGEHAPLSTLDWQRLLQATAGRCANLIRISANDERAIKKVLDIGADGIIAPRVNTAAEAAEIVKWCKYPPRGERGVGLARAQGYGLDFQHYMDNANDEVMVVIQAEHIDAVNNLESIVAVDGIDAVFVGPYDLSASMHKTGQFDDADVIAAFDRIARVCQAKEMPLGYFGTSVDGVKPFVERGYSLVCTGLDAGFITQGVKSMLDGLQ